MAGHRWKYLAGRSSDFILQKLADMLGSDGPANPTADRKSLSGSPFFVGSDTCALLRRISDSFSKEANSEISLLGLDMRNCVSS
jgi:hypothetical protein